LEDPVARLEFSARTDARPVRRRSSRASSMWGWWVTLLAAFGLFMVVRGMLVRGAESAGPSVDATHVVAEAPAPVAEPEIANAIELRASEALVYKCIGRGGAVAYQSEPCAADEATDGTYDAKPDTWQDERRAQLELIERQRQAARLSHIAGTDRPTRYVAAGPAYDARRAQCDAAKAHRAEVLDRVGLARTYDLLQQLDAYVRAQCKGLQ
jgi:hypothetical protein